jgi:hypothetical protein
MNKKILGTLALLMLLPSFSFAQDDDFGVDLGVSAEKKTDKGCEPRSRTWSAHSGQQQGGRALERRPRT